MTAREEVSYLGGPSDGCTDSGKRRLPGYHRVASDDGRYLALWVGDDPTSVRGVSARTTLDTENFIDTRLAASVLGYTVCRLVEEAVLEGAHPGSLTVRVRPEEYGFTAEVRGYKPAPYTKEQR